MALEESVKVTFALRPDANLMRGGAEVQVDRTREALEKLGVQTNVLSSLDPEIGDVVHFIGSWECHYLTSVSVRKRGVPYVCSPIWASALPPFQEQIRTLRKRATGRYPRTLKKLFEGAASVIVLSKWEEAGLRTVFGVNNFDHVPNGVDARFATASPEPFKSEFGIDEDFVLHCGSIYPDKNQLGLIRALAKERLPIVFLGPVLDAAYAEICRKEAGPQVRFLGALPTDSPLLPSAYAAAKVFCLPSRYEVFSLAALEAGAAGCPLVLSNTWGAEEHFGERATYVDYRSAVAIERAVLETWKTPIGRKEQSEHFSQGFSWDRVGANLKDIYGAAICRYAAKLAPQAP